MYWLKEKFFLMCQQKKKKAIVQMGKNNDYTTGKLLDYDYFSNHYKVIVIDLSKQIELENPDLKQQTSFIGNIQKSDWATVFFIIVKSEETILDFHKIL